MYMDVPQSDLVPSFNSALGDEQVAYVGPI